jgi:two-component system NtrC family sensor kinase
MAWITVIGLRTRDLEPEAGIRTTSTSHGVRLARLGMIAAFSLPLFAAWALLDAPIPPHIRSFRVVLTLAAALLMGFMVFIRQRLLDSELVRLLAHSRDSIANLKRLQAQITESEKLASIGHLLGGAAHELNNPITAMLGYSDLLTSTSLTPEQSDLAGKIGQHVRRTRSLVASLLSFAKQGPAAMAPVDLNTLLRTAIKVSQPQWQSLHIEVRAEFPQELLLVRGDSNQLLQVWVQIINDALHVLDEHGRKTLTISAQQKDGIAIVTICDAGVPDSFVEYKDRSTNALESLSALGLSACQGILRQHQGKVLWRQDQEGTSIRVEIPAMAPPSGKAAAAGVPVPWQPQPFA